MDDILWLIPVLWDVPSGNQPGATLALLGWFLKGTNELAAKYFRVKYDFLTNEAKNK